MVNFRYRKTLLSFITNNGDSELLRANRVVAIQFLDKVSQETDLSIQETCVRALAQVARYVRLAAVYRSRALMGKSVSTDDALNIVLHRLVTYLGHANQFIHGVAFDEVFHTPATEC